MPSRLDGVSSRVETELCQVSDCIFLEDCFLKALSTRARSPGIRESRELLTAIAWYLDIQEIAEPSDDRLWTFAELIEIDEEEALSKTFLTEVDRPQIRSTPIEQRRIRLMFEIRRPCDAEKVAPVVKLSLVPPARHFVAIPHHMDIAKLRVSVGELREEDVGVWSFQPHPTYLVGSGRGARRMRATRSAGQRNPLPRPRWSCPTRPTSVAATTRVAASRMVRRDPAMAPSKTLSAS
jgi:hypothetical protein